VQNMSLYPDLIIMCRDCWAVCKSAGMGEEVLKIL